MANFLRSAIISTKRSFSIPTDDGKAHLNGDFMEPADASQRRGVVLIVPGGWFAERDGFMGDTYTDEDLMYLRLANRIRDAGFAVARFDNRGVTGNELTIGLTAGGGNEMVDSVRYVDACVDSLARSSVSPQTQASDVATVVQHLIKSYSISPASLVIFAHSEGGIHVARCIAQGAIKPRGVVLAGTSMLSPVKIMRWQMVDRYVDEVMSWDRDDDGNVSVEDVKASFEGSFLAEVGITQQELLSLEDYWTRDSLHSFFERRYDLEKQQTLQLDDDAPFPDDDSPLVVSSSQWLKQWFIDDTPTVTLLENFDGHISLHYGDIDRQLSVTLEAEAIDSIKDNMSAAIKVVVHVSRGHAFASKKPIAGPMEKESEDMLIRDIIDMFCDG